MPTSNANIWVHPARTNLDQSQTIQIKPTIRVLQGKARAVRLTTT